METAVVLRAHGPTTAEQLQDHVRSRLRRSKTPDRIVVWEEVPRTETGQLIRRSAVEWIVNGLSADCLGIIAERSALLPR